MAQSAVVEPARLSAGGQVAEETGGRARAATGVAPEATEWRAKLDATRAVHEQTGWQAKFDTLGAAQDETGWTANLDALGALSGETGWRAKLNATSAAQKETGRQAKLDTLGAVQDETGWTANLYALGAAQKETGRQAKFDTLGAAQQEAAKLDADDAAQTTPGGQARFEAAGAVREGVRAAGVGQGAVGPVLGGVQGQGLVQGRGLVGQVLASPVLEGEPVTASRILGPGLLRGLPPETVAMPIRLTDAPSAALVRAGDRVDVLASTAASWSAEDGGTSGFSPATTERAARDALVLSVSGGGLGGLGSPAVGGAGEEVLAGMVVLAVRASEVDRLAGAVAGAQVSVAVLP